MKIIQHFLLLCFLLSGLYGFAQNETTVNEILSKHAKSIGLNQRIKVNTMISYGWIEQFGNQLEVTILQKRPDFYRMDVHLPQGRITQAFDGSKGWNLNPFISSDTIWMEGFELQQLKESAVFDGILFNAKELGYTITYEGAGKIENRPTFILMLKKENGNNLKFHLDQKKYLILKTEAEFTIDGLPYRVSSEFKDYVRIKGMNLPFSITNNNGQMLTEMRIDTIRTNIQLENGLFIGKKGN